MPRQVLYSDRFHDGLREDLRHLVDNERREWSALLEADIREMHALLTTVPRVGKLVDYRGERELRRFHLKRTPYVVWYVVEPGTDGRVSVLRLAHQTQRTAARIRW